MSYKIKELPLTERPRERLKEVGPENLSNSELLAIILKNGTKEKNVNDLACELLKKYELSEMDTIGLTELLQIKGIGEVKALELVASIELGKRIFLREKHKLVRFETPLQIFSSTKYLFNNLKQEEFYALYFNYKKELIDKKLLFIGTVNSSTVHPREIFKVAYKLSASFIVCLHNHPSNDVTPSIADINLTNSLIKTGLIQGIPVIDHIIVGTDSYYSFYEHNQIKEII